MTKPIDRARPLPAEKQKLSDADLDAVNGGSSHARQTTNGSFASQIVRGAGAVVSSTSSFR